jgi:hypothetical protein
MGGKSNMSPSKPPNRSLRLLFQFEGDSVKLVSAQRVEMKAPPPQAPPPDTPFNGAWFELRDAQGNSMYRRAIHDAMSGDLEVLSDNPDRPLAHVKSAVKQGVFYLIAPDIPQARTVMLNARRLPLSPATAAEPEVRTHEFELPQEKEGR